MRFLCLLCALAFCAPAALCAGPGPAPRVALVYSDFGNFRHRDNYDDVMKALGWPLDKWENKDFGKLADRLGDYDLLLGSALYNYSNYQDFSQYRAALMGFMSRGGAVAWTDANYTAHVDWLAKWGPDWAVTVAPCRTTTTAMKWLDAGEPLFSAVTPIRDLGASWSQMTPGPGWRIISTCQDGGATGILRPVGRGFMLLTAFWPYSREMLLNLWAAVQLSRAGLAPTFPDLTAFTLGDNVAQSTVRNVGDQPAQVQMRLQVTDPTGRTQRLVAEALVPAGEAARLRLDVRFRARGTYQLALGFARDGKEAYAAPPVSVTVPELLEVTVTRPRYRGDLLLAHWPEAVAVHVALHPFAEKPADLSITARLLQAGQEPAELPARAVPGLGFDLTLPPFSPRAGTAALEVNLLSRGAQGPLATFRRDLRVVAPRPPQVSVDEDLNTRVDGKLFFPIAIYHVPPKDYAQVKSLGFNSVQGWYGGNPEATKQTLDAAQAAGLKVILEGVTAAVGDGDAKVLGPTLAALQSHPALLAWYLTDEPSGEERRAWCRRVYEYLVSADPNHPVFMTSCSPGEFGRYAGVTDIFAVDPYPIPGAVTMVSDWMSRAQEAAGGRKPVWLIPQLHNWAAYDGHPEKGRYPTPEEERNMVYQGLVWGAKAIFYYPWEDGPTGLTHDLKLMAAVKGINSELAALGPELLARTCQVVAQNDAAHPNLYSAVYRGAGPAYVLAVSVAKEQTTVSVPAPGLPDGPAEVLFEGRFAPVANHAIREVFKPLEVHVYRVGER